MQYNNWSKTIIKTYNRKLLHLCKYTKLRYKPLIYIDIRRVICYTITIEGEVHKTSEDKDKLLRMGMDQRGLDKQPTHSVLAAFVYGAESSFFYAFMRKYPHKNAGYRQRLRGLYVRYRTIMRKLHGI